MTTRRLRLDRETLTELRTDQLVLVAGAATYPTCAKLLCAIAEPDETIVVPCYQSSQCSHPC